MEYEKSYWNDRYADGGNSGYGSYNEQLVKKIEWIKSLDRITSISEYGCGDFHFGLHLCMILQTIEYTGLDVSDVIIRKNQERYKNLKFKTIDQELPPADLVLCVDVLFHVIEDVEVEKIFKRLEDAWTKYLVITAYERDEPKSNHVRIRKFDPSRFGTPIIREMVEEDGELYFYVFKK